MNQEPQDIPFYPDWLHRELPSEHHKTWCIAHRLTDRLRARGHTLAITPARNRKMQEAHAAEVRAAVRNRLIRAAIKALMRLDHEHRPHGAAIVDAILADPAIAILVDHHDRRKP